MKNIYRTAYAPKFCAECGKESKSHLCAKCADRLNEKYAGFDRSLKYECRVCHGMVANKDKHCIHCGLEIIV